MKKCELIAFITEQEGGGYAACLELSNIDSMDKAETMCEIMHTAFASYMESHGLKPINGTVN